MKISVRSLPEHIPSLSGVDEVLARIFAARGIDDEKQLDLRLSALLPFDTLLNIDKATARLAQALKENQRILVIGDFDADGATSTALAVSALKAMGAKQIDFLVPNRFAFGYGLTPAIVEVAKDWQPDLIITVDNGIANIEGVAAANAAGIDVLITDHHLPAEYLPDAYAIVNPNQVGDQFLSKSIAGVGVIFYVILALRRCLQQEDWFKSQGLAIPNMAQFLDLVALGTVADVVGLDQNNRIMVSQGLQRIRHGLCRPGILALIEVAGRQVERIRESDLGFAVAPRLNAAGRLDDMSLGISCLLSETYEAAKDYAMELDKLNQMRRHIETEMKAQALEALEKLPLNKQGQEGLPLGLCLFDSSWHQGVIGVLAGRLKERFHRPVITFAKVSDEELKGSARSVSGLNIRDVLAAIDKDHPQLIIKFGGHAMAAGLSITPGNFPRFQAAFVIEVSKQIDPSMCEGGYLTDGSLPDAAFSVELAKLIQQAGPWGQQFPEPSFHNVFEIIEQRIVGQHHLKLTVKCLFGQQFLDAIAFQVDLNLWPNHRCRYIEAVYKLDINHYNNREKLQLIMIEIQALIDWKPIKDQHQKHEILDQI